MARYWRLLLVLCVVARGAAAEIKSLKADAAGRILIDDQPTKLWGLRVACAAAREDYTKQLIDSLKDYHGGGVNLILVNYQGGGGMSRKTFSSDGKAFEDVAVRDRVRRIIDAANAKDMIVIVSLFFPRRMGSPAGTEPGQGGQDPKLATREAYLAACRTAAAELKERKNVIVCVADQPLASMFSATPMKFGTQDIVDCLAAVESIAPGLLRGGGNAVHDVNATVAKSSHALVIFHAEPGLNPPSFPGVAKPIIHFGYAGNETAGRNPQGVYNEPHRKAYADVTERYIDGSTAHVVLHFPAWTEGGMDLKENRFDLGSNGTPNNPGIDWYFEALKRRVRKRPVVEGPGTPVQGGKSIFEN
jgi:hypothetical protein